MGDEPVFPKGTIIPSTINSLDSFPISQLVTGYITTKVVSCPSCHQSESTVVRKNYTTGSYISWSKIVTVSQELTCSKCS